MIDTALRPSYAQGMKVHLSADLELKLTRIAAEQKRDSESLVREAVERLVDYDAWFLREVDEGLAQVERGQTLSYEKAGARLEKYLAAKQPHA
jgi:predicted transcriptional regulator